MEKDEKKVIQKPTIHKGTFKSRAGLIFSCLGCVVGTGNLWRFPRILANNGGDGQGCLVFLLVWLIFLFLWSIPMLLTEYAIGRYTRKAIIQSFRQFVGDLAAWCGGWVTLVTFFISCYYSVILGWTMYYFGYYIGNPLPEEHSKSKEIFDNFAVNSAWPVFFHGLSMLLAAVSVVKGVKTIEKVNQVLVPTLLVIVLFTFVWSLTREYADVGIRFMFSPKWEAFGDPRTWVDAASQNAFDTGAGMGLMIPYAAYMNRGHGIVRYGTVIPAVNNVVSLLCGITIMSTVFSSLILSRGFLTHDQIVDILKDSGPAYTGLTFIWLPVLLSSAGGFGRFVSVLFFLCLMFAGLSSLISNVELASATLEDFGVRRKFGVPIVALLVFGFGLPSALSLDVLTNQDFVWGFALLISGLMLQSLVIIYGANKFRQNVINDFGIDDWKMPRVWHWIVKFVCPIEAVGLLVWWAADLIASQNDKEESWYEFGRETFMVTIVQWLICLVVLIVFNLLLVKFKPSWFINSSFEEQLASDKKRILESSYDISIERHNQIYENVPASGEVTRNSFYASYDSFSDISGDTHSKESQNL